MGQFCFLILFNSAMTTTSARWKYVDDSTLATIMYNINPDYNHLQLLLDRLHTSTTYNKVTLHTIKTTIMHVYTTTSYPLLPPCVSIDAHCLQVVHFVKLLGLTINDMLM